MKKEHAIIVLSIAVGVAAWVLHAVLDFFIFYEDSFWDLLILDLNTSEIYMRTTVFVLFIMFGLFVSRYFARANLAEEKLRQSEERYRFYFDNVGDTVYSIDSEFRISNVSPSVETVLGYRPDEMIGRRVDELNLLSPEYYELAMANTARVFEGQRNPPTEYEFIAKDGSRIMGETISAPLLKDGKVIEVISVARDITRRKEAEAEISRSLSLLNATLDSTADGILAVDKEGKITGYNRKFTELWRIPGSIMESRDDDKAIEFVLDQLEDPEKFVKKVTELYDDPDSESFDVLEFKDGRVFERYSQPQKIEGENIGRVWSFRDVTESRRVEEALRESEKRYAATLDAVPDMVYEATLDGTIVYANPSASRILGYSLDKLGEIRFVDLLDEEGMGVALRVADELIEKKKTSRSEAYSLRAEDGRMIPVEANATLLERKGKPPTILGIARDIRERIKAERALRESEEKYRTLLDSVEVAFYESDLAGNLMFFNDTMLKILGCTEEELKGTNYGEFLEKDDAAKVFETFNKIYRTGQAEKGFTSTLISRDGTRKPFEFSVFLATDEDGKPVAYRGVVRDITDRMLAEEERKKLETRLRHAEKMEAIGTLAGGIAHDFNNLLMVVQGNVSLMLKDLDSSHPHYERLTSIEKQVSSGARLTDQLLGYARGGRYEVIPIDLNQVVYETSNTFGRTRKGIAIHMDLADDLSAIEADESQIEQVLLNLFVNAADAMADTGTLTLKSSNVSHEDMKDKTYDPKPGKYVLLTVIDTGMGMDEETQKRIFDPFFTTKEMARGTGLGMASAYGIIKGHGGYIDVESEKARGSKFSIYLPASEKAVQPSPNAAGEIIRGAGTILLVDDEGMILDVGASMLEELGYSVFEAKGGKEAVEIYKANKDKIDLIILDMIMPGMHGGAVYDILKAFDPGVRVILSSGYSLEGEAAEILERGCDGFIQKPFNMTKLSDEIRTALGGK